jgi:hypothetical protein
MRRAGLTLALQFVAKRSRCCRPRGRCGAYDGVVVVDGMTTQRPTCAASQGWRAAVVREEI